MERERKRESSKGERESGQSMADRGPLKKDGLLGGGGLGKEEERKEEIGRQTSTEDVRYGLRGVQGGSGGREREN